MESDKLKEILHTLESIEKDHNDDGYIFEIMKTIKIYLKMLDSHIQK